MLISKDQNQCQIIVQILSLKAKKNLSMLHPVRLSANA